MKTGSTANFTTFMFFLLKRQIFWASQCKQKKTTVREIIRTKWSTHISTARVPELTGTAGEASIAMAVICQSLQPLGNLLLSLSCQTAKWKASKFNTHLHSTQLHMHVQQLGINWVDSRKLGWSCKQNQSHFTLSCINSPATGNSNYDRDSNSPNLSFRGSRPASNTMLLGTTSVPVEWPINSASDSFSRMHECNIRTERWTVQSM